MRPYQTPVFKKSDSRAMYISTNSDIEFQDHKKKTTVIDLNLAYHKSQYHNRTLSILKEIFQNRTKYTSPFYHVA